MISWNYDPLWADLVGRRGDGVATYIVHSRGCAVYSETSNRDTPIASFNVVTKKCLKNDS